MKVIDLRGEECPGPITKVLRAFAELSEGEELIVLMTSKKCVDAIKAIMNYASVRIEQQIEGKVYKLRIFKEFGDTKPLPKDTTC